MFEHLKILNEKPLPIAIDCKQIVKSGNQELVPSCPKPKGRHWWRVLSMTLEGQRARRMRIENVTWSLCQKMFGVVEI